MNETKSAKLLCEVQWGVIPGTVEGQRQWGFSRDEIDAAFPMGSGTWQDLMSAAYEEFDRRMNPAESNWVTMTWLWL
jgi:hypothetical protein